MQRLHATVDQIMIEQRIADPPDPGEMPHQEEVGQRVGCAKASWSVVQDIDALDVGAGLLRPDGLGDRFSGPPMAGTGGGVGNEDAGRYGAILDFGFSILDYEGSRKRRKVS